MLGQINGVGSNARESLVSEGRRPAARGEMLGVPRRVDEDERPGPGTFRAVSMNESPAGFRTYH